MTSLLIRRLLTQPTYVTRRSVASSRRYSTSEPRRGPSTLLTISFATALTLTSYTLGALFPAGPLTIIAPRPAPPPPTDPDTPEAKALTDQLHDELECLPLLQELRTASDKDDWYETRPYKNFPEERKANNLTAGALRGPGKLGVIPLVRARRDETASVVFLHVGRGVCGHDGIVHGGLLATLLDETLARTAISNLPEKVGVTANLSLNYKAPTRADQFIVIKTQLVEQKGRKAVVSGRVEDLAGAVLVEATGTFVQPRYAKLLNTTALKQAMGEPAPSSEPVLLADGVNIAGGTGMIKKK